MSKKLILENISKDEIKTHIKDLYNFLCREMPKIDKPPRLFFEEDQSNADDYLGKTGYYDPDTLEIHLYVTDRHGKDILRSFAHEMVHHEQNCSGVTATLDMSKTHEPDYAEKDEGLHEAERDAFERGNMLFRKWTDGLKAKRQKGKTVMNEVNLKKVIQQLIKEVLAEKVPKPVVKKAHKIAKSVAKSGTAEEPYAVGMAAAKKQAGLEEEEKDPVKKADKQARRDARDQLKNYMGGDLKKMKEQSDFESVEALQENVDTPYPQLFEPKERVLQDAFQKREQIIFDELVKRITKENKG